MTERNERIEAVKKRLNAERAKRGETVNAVAEALAGGPWYVTRYAARAAFSESSGSLEAAALLAICERWGLDVAEVTRDPAAPRDSFARPEGPAFEDLTDANYEGTYRTYSAPRKEGREGELWEGEFEIRVDAAARTNVTTLTVTEKTPDGDAPWIVKRYRGKSTLSAVDRAVVSILSNERGGMVVIWFRYEPYVHTSGMYFRVANVMTCDLPSRRPLVQRMAMFDHEPKAESLPYVAGMLRTGDGTVSIGREALARLRETDEEVDAFCRRHAAAMERETEETLSFTFDSLNGARVKTSASDSLAFLKIMAASYAPLGCVEWTPGVAADLTRKM